MENKGVEFLLGLDMLKRHQAIIDLKENVLSIGDEKVEFLPEHQIPSSDRFENEPSPSQPSPGPMGPVKPTGSVSGSVSTGSTGPSSTIAPQVPPTKSTNPPTSKYPESAIQALVGLGVTREEAIGALDLCGGNADLAASMLFQ